MESQFEIRISGRVQGVGFRAAARREARHMRLRGWVENLGDGSVRAVICGKRKNCMTFINWCREGSAYSWVQGIDVQEKEAENLGPFEIRY
jgi:acylphosphatase